MMRLAKDEALLLFVDVQGRLHELMDGKAELDAALERLVRGAALLGLPRIVTEQIPEKLGGTNEPFASLLEGVPVIAKHTFSCLGEPRFVEALRATGRRQVILCGIETHVCIYQTALDLLAEGFEVCVAADAVSSRRAENRRLALEEMARSGAAVLPVESILFALLRDAADPAFRDLLKLIK